MAQQIRLSEQEKLCLIQELIEQLTHKRQGLQVIRSDDALQGQNIYSTVHIYQLLGVQNIRKTQTNNLIQKVQEAHKKKNSQQQQPVQAEQNRQFFRYYRNNIRCFRCKKIGHHNYACLDQTACNFCLSGQHCTDRCPQRTVCYQCYQYGHMVNECQAPPGAFCVQCKRKHNKVCYFLTKGIDPIKQMFNTDFLSGNRDIRCMRCLQYGHLVCQPKEERLQGRN